MKSLHNFSNVKPNDPHGFKEELKIKFDAVLAVIWEFSNRAGPMLELLKAKTPSFIWVNYCAMDVVDQAMRKERGDASNKAILF